MDFKRLQKWVDKGISVLADHDDKKREERYINLQNIIQEAQDFIDKSVYSAEVDKEFQDEIKGAIKEYEESKWIFIIFLIILVGLLFIGVFYITYSHFYDHWYNGGHFIPPHYPTNKPNKPDRPKPGDDDKTKTTSATNKTTSSQIPSSSSTTVTTSSQTPSSSKTTVTTKSTTITTKPKEDSDDELGFVTVIFDNSNLVDIENVYPMSDDNGKKTTPTTWKLYSTLSKGSKDYKVRYTVNFVDNINDIDKLLDVNIIKFQLIAINNGVVQYDSGVQYYSDYPEVEYRDGKLYRPIITSETSGNTFMNDETLEFELRVWLDETGLDQNNQQGKKYKFNIFIEAEYEFIE